MPRTRRLPSEISPLARRSLDAFGLVSTLVCTTTCGDSVVAGSEACDDGGTSGGDGCDAVCQVEPGYQCSGEPSMCTLTTAVPMLGRALRLGLAVLLAGAGVLAVRRRVLR